MCIVPGKKRAEIGEKQWAGEAFEGGVHGPVFPCQNIRALHSALQKAYLYRYIGTPPA